MKSFSKTAACSMAALIAFTPSAFSEPINLRDPSVRSETQLPESDLTSAAILDSWHARSKISAEIANASLIQNKPENILPNTPLRGLIMASLERDDGLKAVLHDSIGAYENYNAARARLLPEINVQAEIERTKTHLNNSHIYRREDNKTGSIEVNWTVYSSGTRLSSIRAAKFNALAADMNYLAEERRELLEGLGIYLQVLAGQKLVASLNQTKYRMQRILKSTKQQFKAGFASRTDIAQVESELASINTQLEQARQAYNQNRIMWETKSGTKVSPKLKLPRIALLIPKNKSRAVSKALEYNPAVIASDYTATAAFHEAHAVKGQYLPSVSVYGTLETDFGSSRLNERNDWTAGVRLNIPILNVAGVAQHRRARQAALASRYRAQDQKYQISREVEVNWSNLQSHRKQKRVLLAKIRANKNIVKGIEKEVKAGLRPVGDLLREEINLTDARIQHFQNDINRVAAAYRIAIHFPDITLNSFDM